MSHSDMMIDEMNTLEEAEHQKELEEHEQWLALHWWAGLDLDIEYQREINDE